jgi:N-methylhydantoinase A/oxoprolinase/acetone carboxylase beta subunit
MTQNKVSTKKRILIGCPVHDGNRWCIERYIQAVRSLDHDGFDYDILLADNSKDDVFFQELTSKGIKTVKVPYKETARERIKDSRNALRDEAITGGYDHLFSLEADLVVRKDTLMRLLSHRTDIITAYYGTDVIVTLKMKNTQEIKKALINMPIIYLQSSPDKVRRANPKEILDRGVIQIGAMGLGCALISRQVLEKIKFRLEDGKKACDDMFFCIDAKKAGYNLYLDSDHKIEHEHRDWGDIKR